MFMVMDDLNQVCRRHRTEKRLLHSHDVTGRVAENFNNRERLGYISLLHFVNDDAAVFDRNFHHQIQDMSVSMTIAQCEPDVDQVDLSHTFQLSLSGGTLVITVGIRNTNLLIKYHLLIYQ